MKTQLTHAFFALLTLSIGTACGDDDDNPTSSGGNQGGNGGAGAQGGGPGGEGGGGEGGGSMGEPFDVPAGQWSFVDFPDSQCIDGSPTGIGVNPGTSGDVVILLQGGNACFNTTSCLVTANTDGYDAAKFEADGATGLPLFDRGEANNPLKDDSFVYVPYCTGDLHLGEKLDGEAGGEPRVFSGYLNFKMYLERIVASYPDAERVVLIGLSAGGFGAMGNYDTVAKAFPSANVVLVDDSGPFMSATSTAPCLQQRFLDTWGISEAFEDCSGCVPGNFTQAYVEHLVATYPTANLALISSRFDGTISNFLGYGTNDCANIDALLPPNFDTALYEEGLEEVRDELTVGSNFKLFLIDGNEHVFLNEAPGTVVVDSVELYDWFHAAITGGAAFEHVPAP